MFPLNICSFVGDLLMVVGGFIAPFNPIPSVEVFDLSGQNRICKPVADYPYPIAGHAMATINGQPIVCGGWKGGSTNECYRYDGDDNQWKPFPSMKTKRFWHQSLQLGKNQFMMAGQCTTLNSLMLGCVIIKLDFPQH